MNEDQKILFDILKAIQEHCKKKTNCNGCILSEEKPEYSTCRLHHAPQYWRLEEK